MDSRTRVTVRACDASALASKRGSIGVIGSLERIGASGGEVDTAFHHAASRSRRCDPKWNAETITNPDIVKVPPVRLTQGELSEGDRSNPLFPKRERERERSSSAPIVQRRGRVRDLQAPCTPSHRHKLRGDSLGSRAC